MAMTINTRVGSLIISNDAEMVLVQTHYDLVTNHIGLAVTSSNVSEHSEEV